VVYRPGRGLAPRPGLLPSPNGHRNAPNGQPFHGNIAVRRAHAALAIQYGIPGVAVGDTVACGAPWAFRTRLDRR